MARNVYGLDLGSYEIKIYDKKKMISHLYNYYTQKSIRMQLIFY